MGVSDCEAVNVTTFSWFRALLRLRRPHEASRRPPRRPSSDEVEAGGNVSARRKREESLSVEKRAAKHGERSYFHSDDHTILLFVLKFIVLSYTKHIIYIYIYIILVYFAAVLRYKGSGFCKWRRFLLREIMTRSQEPHKYQVQGHVNL